MSPQKSVIKIDDIMMYVGVAVQHFRLMVLLLALSMTLGLFYYSYSRPVYYAQCLVKVNMLDMPVTTDTVYKDSDRKYLRAQLQSPYLIERTAKRFGIYAPARVIEQRYMKRLRVEFDPENNLRIEVYPYSYELARHWTEALITEYIASRDEKRVEQMKFKITEDSAAMEDIRVNLEKNMLRRREFSQSNNLLRIQIEMNQLKDLPARLAIARKHLDMMDEVRQTLGKLTDPVARLSLLSSLERDTLFSSYKDMQLQVGEPIQKEIQGAPVVIVPQDMAGGLQKPWEALDKEKRRLENEIADKSVTFLPGHHQIQSRMKELERVNRGLEMEYEAALHRFNMAYDALTERIRALEAKVSTYDEVFRRHNQLLQESELLEASQPSWLNYAKKIGQQLSHVDFAADREKIQLEYRGPLEPISETPLSPNPIRVALMATIFGLALAISIPFLIVYLDNSASDIEQVEESLRIQGLGVVPRIDERSVNNLLIPGLDAKPAAKPEYHLQENFRIIRTNLIMHSETANLPQVIIVTSAMPQEGKTVVAANLAMSFATKGEKTLLVDGDLRRGRLHRLFGAENKPGLSDVLSGYARVSDACRPSGHENLTIMTCGKHLNWASELLDNPGYSKIIEDLRAQYTRVIIDTPPALGLSETSIMQRFSDGVLMVIWSNHTQMSSVKDAIGALQSNGAKFLGFVLNQLDFAAFANRYKYFYYSPRYYTNYKAIEASVLPAPEQ